jgi:predicted dinucleotide-binding enzyme
VNLYDTARREVVPFRPGRVLTLYTCGITPYDAAHVQTAVPRSQVAAAFHHLPARALAQLDKPMEGDVLICSDHPEAYDATARLVELIPGLRPLNAGSLSNAAPIEAITAVLLQLNVRYKTRTALQLTGITLER